MNREYLQAREVTELYSHLGDAQEKIEQLLDRIKCLEMEVNALLSLSQDYLKKLQIARSSFWI